MVSVLDSSQRNILERYAEYSKSTDLGKNDKPAFHISSLPPLFDTVMCSHYAAFSVLVFRCSAGVKSEDSVYDDVSLTTDSDEMKSSVTRVKYIRPRLNSGENRNRVPPPSAPMQPVQVKKRKRRTHSNKIAPSPVVAAAR